MSLIDLDELLTTCRTEEAKSYVAEAVASYKAGAFRACIVATWIAIVYDLISKIRELALGGDAEALKLTTELAKLQPKIESGDQGSIKRILEIEREIVEIANDKFAFFEGQQVIDLKRLQDDRNRCAHPTYQGAEIYKPSAELARMHLVHAVHHVLANPPVQGKAATEQIVRLVESSLFPIDIDQAKSQLKLGDMERPKESLVRAVIDTLVFEFFEGKKELKATPRALIAIRAVYEMSPGICEPRLRKNLNSIGRRLKDGELAILLATQSRFEAVWGFSKTTTDIGLVKCLSNQPIAAPSS
jgi:hypothetical protein